MSKLTILDKSAVIRNETQPLANTRGRVADVLEDIANTLVDQDDLNAEATARDQGDAMKLNKPNSDGSYYIAKTTVAGIPYYQYRDINLSSGQIPVSRGSYIGASLLYESVSGRIGLDTQAPSEKFEVYNGRVKADGFILTSSAVSPLPREIKFKGGNFVGAKDDGIEHKFLMGGDLDTELTAKLDKGGYTGTAQDLKNSIDSKLNKPTTTSNTTSYPFVVGEDGNGNSARLPAGDLGKNFFNADLSNTTARNHTMNAGVTVNTLGNAWNIKGLPNKASDTTNFESVVRYNPITGQFAYGQAFVYNVPSTITVNHVNAPTSPDVPSYVQAIQDRITQLSQLGVVMQKFTNWTIKSLKNTTNSTNVEGNTNIYTDTTIFNTNSAIITNTEVVSVHTNKILPKNADWIILFNIKLASDGAGNNTAPKTNRLMGIHNSEIGTLIIPSLYLFDSTYGYATHNLAILKNGGGRKIITSSGGTNTSGIIFEAIPSSIIPAMILKVGDNILIQAQYGSTTISEIYSAQALSGDDFGFCVTARKSSIGIESIGNVSNVRYYIFP